MRNQEEAKLQQKIIRKLNMIPNTWAKAHVANLYTGRGHPDIYGVCKGRFFAGEVKLPGEKPTTIQQVVLKKLKECGALTFLWYSVEQAVRDINKLRGDNNER